MDKLEKVKEALEECQQCCGAGYWETECCNGSFGCSCGGSPVYMGKCNVCNGAGEHNKDADTGANWKSIQGVMFHGSGGY